MLKLISGGVAALLALVVFVSAEHHFVACVEAAAAPLARGAVQDWHLPRCNGGCCPGAVSPLKALEIQPVSGFLLKLKPFFYPLDSSGQAVIPDMLRGIFRVQVARVTLEPTDACFDVAQALFDLLHILPDGRKV